MSSGGWAATCGLGLYSQASELSQPLLQLANGREILVHSLAIGGPEGAVQAPRLVADEVEHAAALLEGLDIRRDFFRLALHEQLLKNLLRAPLGGDRGAAAGETESLAFVTHRQRQRGIPRLVADLLGGILIERHPVAEAAPLGMRRAGQEALFRRVGPGHARQADAGKHRHLIAMRGQAFQVRARRVVLARLVGEKELRQDPHVRFDRHHPPRNGSRSRRPKSRPHRIE